MNGHTRQAKLSVTEETAGILDVVDRIVNDEVAYVHVLIGPSQPEEPQPKKPMTPVPATKEPKKANSIDVALSLDGYMASAKLLPSLYYIARGTTCRLSAIPEGRKQVLVDFDIGQNSHELERVSRTRKDIICFLPLPATNGRVSILRKDDETLVDIFIGIDAVKLDAASIQSLLNTVNSPEISNVIDNAQDEIDITQKKLQAMFARGEAAYKAIPSASSPPLVYRCCLSFDGVSVHATAPAANLEAGIGRFQLKATNKPSEKSAVLTSRR